MNWAIETDDLGKHYKDVKAVEHLSLRVTEGEIYAFLGLNGAGKTTTIRMLLGMIKPTTGSAKVLNTIVRLGRQEPWQSVGYLVETPHSYPELTVHENLEAARRFHPGTPHSAVDQIIERLSLSEYAHRRTGDLSQGNAQRLGLAKALIHNPKLLFLDEPANGLDPAGIVEIRELLQELTREQGVTVFMSSHILAEVSKLAQRIGIIHQGHLIKELSIDELEQMRHRKLSIRVNSTVKARQLLIEAGEQCELLDIDTLQLSSQKACLHPEDINHLLVNDGYFPSHLVVEEEALEDYFLRLINEENGSQNG